MRVGLSTFDLDITRIFFSVVFFFSIPHRVRVVNSAFVLSSSVMLAAPLVQPFPLPFFWEGFTKSPEPGGVLTQLTVSHPIILYLRYRAIPCRSMPCHKGD